MVVKPGIKTTEFWATLLVNLAIFVSTFTSSLPAKDQLIATVIVNGLYIASRTLVKAKSISNVTDLIKTVEQLLGVQVPPASSDTPVQPIK